MKPLTIVLVVMLMLTVTVSGCVTQEEVSEIESDEQAQETIKNVSEKITDLEKNLQKIEQSLGEI